MKKFLVVIDMQKDFIDGTLGTKEAEAIVPNVLNKIREYNGPVLYTRDTHGPEYLSTAEGKKLPVEHCIKDTEGWALQQDIGELAKDSVIFDKPTFGSTQLAEYLKAQGAEEVELVGLCTDICVISNALLIKAFLPECRIMIDPSCCAGVTPESHDNALNAMQMCQIEIQKPAGN